MNVCSNLKLKGDGAHRPCSGDQVLYLKKRITLTSDGILVQPNASYVPKLVSLMHVSNRGKKGLPYHATLENYAPELIADGELLSVEDAKTFRSGLGLALYIAGVRPDVQFPVKILASYMSQPPSKAMSALKHLACYLDGTPDVGVLLRNATEHQSLFDH